MWCCQSKKWKKVSHMVNKCSNISKLSIFNSTYKMRYCLVTENHTIPTLDGQFKDFQEYSECSNKICKNALQTLRKLNPHQNKCTVQSKFEKGEKQSGLQEDTLISTLNGRIPIKNIKIGTELKNREFVIGKYCVSLDSKSIHNKCNQTGCQLPIDQIIWNKENKCWNKTYTENIDIKKNNIRQHGYHLVTTNGSFKISTVESNQERLIRDFLEKPLLRI